MFTTFNSNANSWKSVQTQSSGADQPSLLGRAKRSQVNRACLNCRQQRIRCNNEKPCTSCKQKNIKCVVDDRRSTSKTGRSSRSPRRGQGQTAQAASPDSLNDQTMSESSPGPSKPRGVSGTEDMWEDSSFNGLFSRVTNYANELASVHGIDRTIDTATFNRVFVGENIGPPRAEPSSFSQQWNEMTLAQQYHSIQLFWHSYHILYPFMRESQCRVSHAFVKGNVPPELTTESFPALLDITLALCRQLFPSHSPPVVDAEEDSSGDWPEGWDNFIRFQSLLSMVSMQPKLNVLASMTLATMYLDRAGRGHAARAMLSSAVSMAMALERRSKNPSETESIVLSRIWLSLYVLDTRLCMDLGTPCLVENSIYRKHKSSAAKDIEKEPKYTSASDECNWLDHHVQMASLMMILRRLHADRAVPSEDMGEGVDATKLLEEKARGYNRDTLRRFNVWREDLDDSLKTPRIDDKPPLSLHQSPLQIDLYQPIWTQRQRISLELGYHEVKMNLYAGFFRYPPVYEVAVPVIESHQTACLHHAMVNAMIVSQVTAELTAVDGPAQFVRYLFRAAICHLAFILAQPLAPLTQNACKSLWSLTKTLQKLEPQSRMATTVLNHISAVMSTAEVHVSTLSPALSSENLSPLKQDASSLNATASEHFPLQLDELNSMIDEGNYPAFATSSGVFGVDQSWMSWTPENWDQLAMMSEADESQASFAMSMAE